MSRRILLLRALLSLVVCCAAAAPVVSQVLYWENPRVFVPQGISSSVSVSGSSFISLAWQEIRPRSATDRTSGDIFLSLAVSSDGMSWTTRPRVYGPIRYTGVKEGLEPRVYSIAMDASDRILVAVATSDRETVILQSTDQGVSFRQVQRLSSRAAIGVPNLFVTNGGFLLLMSQGSANGGVAAGSVTLAYSHSRDGRSWSELAPFVTASDAIGEPQLQPSHATFQGREFVVFESLTVRTDLTSTWQLFVKKSSDGGATWGAATPLTSAGTLVGGKAAFGADPLGFDNERPRLAALGKELALVWERSPFGSNQPQIWSARLDAEAALTGAPEIVSPDRPSRFAHVLTVRGQEYILYADGSTGTSRITLAQKGTVWQTQLLQNTDPLNAVFPHAVQFKSSLFIFWENQATSGAVSALIQLQPLRSVGTPVVQPVDFTPERPAARDSITVSWNEAQPPDPAGIKEYRYAWTFSDGVTTVEKERRSVSGLTSGGRALFSTRKVDQDGTWTFSVTAEDLAGNVSPAPATISFTRDATPPRAVSFEVVGADGSVLLSSPPSPPDKREVHSHAVQSNTFTLRWVPGPDKDIVGYTYEEQPGWATLAEYEQSPVALLTPPSRVVTTATNLPKFDNRDNGVYVFTVQAVDRAGNFSPPSTVALELTHYQLVTRVDRVFPQKDPVLGTVRLTIFGRGFRDNGAISKIYLDRAHRGPPWDIELDPSEPVTITDRQISGIVLDQNSESGAYRIGLQQKRPNGEDALYFTPRAMFEFLSPGTVKIGNFQITLPNWIARPSAQYVVSFDALLVVLVVALLGTLSIFAFRKIVALALEGAAVRTEVAALLAGRPNARWEERKKRMQALKRKGIGLRLKFTLLMVVLVTMIVLIVSIPLGYQMVSKQRSSLVKGLQDSANILLGALASSAETQIRQGDQGFFAAADMPALRTTMSDALYTTITGPDRNFRPADPKDLVWASDEKRFADELKAGRFNIAAEKVDDELARSVVPALQKKVDAEAAAKFAPLIEDYRGLQGQRSSLQGKTDATSRAQLTALNDRIAQAARDIDTQAKNLYGVSATLELLNPNSRLLPEYLFYKPVIFYNRAANVADTTFYQGMIRLQVKTETISRQIDDSIKGILTTASGIALAAIALGILGAILMASITVTPIRRLAQGVAVIRDTDDKEDLKDHVIVVKTRDEIGSLAATVNEMTQGLVKAAIDNKLLLAGIDVQKRFLPLTKDSRGGEASTAMEENPRLEIFGYYKGAKGVSGDYFDFKRLDDTYYAMIKCDVSGKGVAAALIMVEVATLFINYFKDWPKRTLNITRLKDPKAKERAIKELERLDELVYTINEMVEGRGFRGKFATLNVVLFNSETGVANICNAGDTKLNIYRARDNRLVTIDLPDSPAAGMFPNMMVDMKTPYKQVKQQLLPGDVLFLATDGFQDSEHHFRDADFKEIVCAEPGLGEKEHHKAHGGDHEQGEKLERFDLERESELRNAVLKKGVFRLIRNHNPIPDEEIVFDFSACQGTAQEVVLAQVAVDRVYRMVPNPSLTDSNTIEVESIVADFLKKHFLQYDRYFSHHAESEKDTGKVTFTHAMEAGQADDLTILVVRRK